MNVFTLTPLPNRRSQPWTYAELVALRVAWDDATDAELAEMLTGRTLSAIKK